MNCKPGDMAICMSGESTPEMAGRIVKVIRLATNGEVLSASHRPLVDEPSWVIEAEGSLLPTRTLDGVFLMFQQRAFADRLMRPVSGLSDTEDTTTDTPIKELA